MRKACLASIAVITALTLGETSRAKAQRLLSDGVTDLAAQITTSVEQQSKRRVAVIPFRELDGRPTVLATYLSEALVTELFKRGSLDIVERTMLDRVMAELRLGQSGIIDPATAKQVGQVAGVDAIVTGTITDLQSFVVVNCRLIDVQSGRVFAAADTKIVKDDDVRKMMGMATVPTDSPAGTPREPSASARTNAVAVQPATARPGSDASSGLLYGQTISKDPFSFRLRECRSATTRFVCRISVTTSVTTVEQLWVDADQCYLMDRSGNQYKLVSINDHPASGRMGTELPPGVDKPLEMAFAGAGAVGDAEPVSVVTRWWKGSVFYVVFK